MTKRIITSFILSLLLLTIVLPVSAKDLEVDYPEMGGEDVATSTTISGYIDYLYRFAITVAAIAGFVILLYAGFRYLTSAGNPVAMKDAVSKITSATIGLILLLGIHLVITTLWGGDNLPEINKPEPVSGIYLQAGTGEEANKLHYQSSVSVVPEKFDTLQFVGPKEEIYSVFLYDQKNFQGTPTKEIKNDGGTHSLGNAQSLKIKFNKPGVYVKGKNLGEEVFLTHSVSDFTFTPQVEEVVIKNREDETTDMGKYYSVLHTQDLFLGGCQIISATTSDIQIQPHSVTVFRRNNFPNQEAQTIIYSAPNYQNAYSAAEDETIEEKTYPGEEPQPVAVPDRLAQNIKSVKVPPGYAVILFEEKPVDNGSNIYTEKKCQIFYESNPNLDKEYIGNCGGEGFTGLPSFSQIPCATYIMILAIETLV